VTDKKPLIEVKSNTSNVEERAAVENIKIVGTSEVPRKMGNDELNNLIKEELFKFTSMFVDATLSPLSEGKEGTMRLSIGELKQIIKEELERAKERGWAPLPQRKVCLPDTKPDKD